MAPPSTEMMSHIYIKKCLSWLLDSLTNIKLSKIHKTESNTLYPDCKLLFCESGLWGQAAIVNKNLFLINLPCKMKV